MNRVIGNSFERKTVEGWLEEGLKSVIENEVTWRSPAQQFI